MTAADTSAWSARLAWITCAGAPPVLILGLSPGVVSAHPTLAAVLVLLYEAALAVLSFAGRVAHELEQRWTQGVVDFVDHALRRRLSGFGRHYRSFVLRSLRYIDLKGLATVGFCTPELDDVFVDVSVARRSPNQVGTGLLACLPAEVTERRSVHEFLNKREPALLAVVGVPGSGKTTLLRHLARTAAGDGHNRVRNVPILVYLRDHVDAIVRDPAVTLPALLHTTLDRLTTPEPEGWFEARLRRGRCVVLLDGLDEVARPKDRRLVADWVERLTRKHPRNDYVITSRPQGYRDATVDGATVLQVRAFTDEQVAAFVRGWYRAVERLSTGAANADDIQLRAEPMADDLLDRLRIGTSLYDLTVNPLLLTMIANVHRYRGALPGSRTELYAEICQVMLWRRQESKQLHMELSGEKKEILLRGLAFTMMQRRVRDLSRAQVVAELNPVLRRTAGDVTAEDFIADISSNGLLIERESGTYSFTHLTFQEYLAATQIRDKGLIEVLTAAVDDVWWRETTLMYAARSDADPIITACLASPSVSAMVLAFECADEASEVAPELRARLDQLVAAAFAPGVDAERRRQMAGVLVARHLRTLVPAQDGARVCVEPITTGLYWLFLQDHPQHRPDGDGEAHPSVHAVVRGVRGSDALAFVAWVNDLVQGELTVRLPTMAEAEVAAARRELSRPDVPDLRVWVARGRTGQVVEQVSVSHEDENRVTTGRLVLDVTYDFEREPATLCTMMLIRTVAVIRLLALTLRRWGADVPASTYLFEDLSLLARHTGSLVKDDHHATLELAYRLATGFLTASRRTSDVDRLTSDTLWPAHDAAPWQQRGARSLLEDMLCLGIDEVLTMPMSLPPSWAENTASEHAVRRRLDDVQGVAVSRSLASTLRETDTDGGTWSDDFGRALQDELAADPAAIAVTPDTLLSSFDPASRVRLADFAAPDEKSWRQDAVVILERLSLTVARRQTVLTTGLSRGIRLTALCLAAEARSQGDAALARTFHQAAAGVLLLQRRNDSTTIPDEAIILATS
jgi:energy-coupling factor transporter ATP-binding protein EcfA2